MWNAFSRSIINFFCDGQSKRTHIIKPEIRPLSPVLKIMPPVGITEEQVKSYLHGHPDFLERHVLEEVDIEHLERWIIRKSQRLRKKLNEPPPKNGRKTSLSRWKFCVHADKRQMLEDLTHSLQQRPTKDQVFWELGNCICSAVNADGFRLYLVDHGIPETLYLGVGNSLHKEESKILKVKSGVQIPYYVSRTHQPVRFSRGDIDSRFPDGIPDEGEIAHILCQPISQPEGELSAVLEVWRKESGGPFHEEDEEIASSYLVWGGIATHYADLYFNMNQQKELNEFLLVVVKSVFQDMVSMNALVIKIMNFAQKLVEADRASLFLVDGKNKELYATIFDIGLDGQSLDWSPESEEFTKLHTSKEIRFPLGTGIAGQVAMTGEVLNIKDAYADPRFNRNVDQQTGYRTDTILCMPIFRRSSIIGVVQMVNKRGGHFTKEDEEAFETFAIYCGLALHHATLYDEIKRSEQKYRVALEVLSYHNTCDDKEYQLVKNDGIPDNLVDIDNYYFNPFEIEDLEKAKYSIFMFMNLFGFTQFDPDCLIKFTLTVKKNYRRVPYHNWTHGFSVANCMYSIIKRSGETYTLNESLALFIGALCHDLDHRGKNNKFMLESEAPLAFMYSTSTMEHHHFNQTVAILQQEGHNIFAKLSDTEYKEVLYYLKHCILATDLALFFPKKFKLTKLVQENLFSWSNPDHRLLLQAISMTGSDLSASAKPWNVQEKTVKVVFEEFYQQGDAEKAAGRQPIPMMDREQPNQQAASQVAFLTNICIPCYSILFALIPETKPLLDMCKENLRRWQQIDDNVNKTEPIDSV